MKGIINKLKKLWEKWRRHALVEEDVLIGLDIDLSELYEDPNVALKLQERYLENIQDLDRLIPQYRDCSNKIVLVQRFESLNKSVKTELEKMIKLYSETLINKSIVQSSVQVSKRSGGEYLEDYEEHIPDVIRLMEEHEQDLSIVKRDLSYLEGEMAELKYQFKRFSQALAFVKYAYIGLSLTTALAALGLTMMYFLYKRPMGTLAIVTMVGVVLLTLWVFVFRRYLIAGLKKNIRLQKRCVELSNKTKIKFVNNQKVIDYQCRKYKVDSSEMLKLRWDSQQKKNLQQKQYKNLTNTISAVLNDMEVLLNKNGITDFGFIEEQMAYFESKSGREKLMEQLEREKSQRYDEIQRKEKESHVLNLVLTNYRSR